MDKLYPIVRRVRRPLLPVDEPQRRGDAEGTGVPATAPSETEKVSDKAPDPASGSPVQPEE